MWQGKLFNPKFVIQPQRSQRPQRKINKKFVFDTHNMVSLAIRLKPLPLSVFSVT
jgi:hypothetical protein